MSPTCPRTREDTYLLRGEVVRGVALSRLRHHLCEALCHFVSLAEALLAPPLLHHHSCVALRLEPHRSK
jgi:hypothetical protein